MRPPEVTVHAILLDETRRKILLIKYAPRTGRKIWGFPGGHIRVGEKVGDALKREVKEETGYEIDVDQLLGAYDNIIRDDSSDKMLAHLVNIVWTAKVVSGNLDSSKDIEILDAQWLPFAEARELPMSPTGRRILRDAVRTVLGECKR